MLMTYVVRPGDHLEKIAHDLGADADALWNHPKNEELRKTRRDRNILSAGDVLFVPAEEAAPLPLKIGQANRFAAIVPRVETHLRFADAAGPFAGEAYVVEGLGEPANGSTDADGKLTIKAPVSARVASVRFEKRGLSFHVLLGEMDPISEISGVQLRLALLGFMEGPATGELDEPTAEALRSFQKSKRLEVKGAIDEATRSALVEAYGC